MASKIRKLQQQKIGNELNEKFLNDGICYFFENKGEVVRRLFDSVTETRGQYHESCNSNVKTQKLTFH